MMTDAVSIPKSWSLLSWQQLCLCWKAKVRYGGSPDVARVAAMLSLLGVSSVSCGGESARSGETVYCLAGGDGRRWTATAREAAWAAGKALVWFDYPYGDPGEKELKDEKGNVVRERRDPVRGYVSPMGDAMVLPLDELKVCRRHFALPQVACNNLTWQQYRSLQAIAPQLFQEGIGEKEALALQAQFMSHALVPRSVALLDTAGGSIRLRPHYTYKYSAEQADGLSRWWEKRLPGREYLFYIAFQAYQTAVTYYSDAYPLLFGSSDRQDKVRDALQGEVGTINTIMKYAGYAEQQQVYDSNLPFVLDILNTMAKEAREIEKMNAKLKRK